MASKNGQPIFLAGIWSGETYAILTYNADSVIESRDIRNPIALEPENARKWMNEGYLTAGHLLEASVSASKFQWLQVDEVMSRHCYERTPFKLFGSETSANFHEILRNVAV